MAWDRRRQGETERPENPAPGIPGPTLRRPSNPTTVAKALGPPDRASRAKKPVRGKKRKGAEGAPAPVPTSVTMSVAGLLRGEAAPQEPQDQPPEGLRWGVLYRLVVRDSDDRPIAPGAFAIRRHLLHLSSGGCFAAIEKGARISIVALEADGSAFDFVGVSGAEPPAGEGEERLVEYFSFELQGVTYAIPRSGFVLARSRKAGRLDVVRTPRGSASVHGGVVPGLVTDGGADTYVLALRD
jgi:hypothetical protein